MADVSRNPQDNATMAQLRATLEGADASVARTVRADAENLTKRARLLSEEKAQQEVALREIAAATAELKAATIRARVAGEGKVIVPPSSGARPYEQTIAGQLRAEQQANLAGGRGLLKSPAYMEQQLAQMRLGLFEPQRAGVSRYEDLASQQALAPPVRGAYPPGAQGSVSEERAKAIATRERAGASSELNRTLTQQAVTERRLQESSEGALSGRFLQRIKEGNATFAELGQQVGITIGKFAGWTAAAGAVYGVIGLFGELKRGVVDAQSGVENLQRFIPNLNKGQAYKSFTAISSQLNVPVGDVATAEGQFARIFKNQADVQTAARVSILATKLDNVSLADSYRYLTSLTQEFKLSAQDLPGVFDKLASAQANAGGKVSDLYQAIAKSSGVLRGAGVTNINDIIALENTFQVRSGQTGNVIGTGFARGAANFFPSTKSQDLLKSFGIDTTNFATALRDAIAKVSSGAIPRSDAVEISKAFFGPLRGGLFTTGFSGADQLAKSDRAVGPAAAGQAERELQAKLKQADEVFKSIGNSIQRLGAQLATSGFLDAFLSLAHIIGFLVTAVGSGISELSKVLGIFGSVGKELPGVALEVLGVLAVLRKFNVGANSGIPFLSKGAGAAGAGEALAVGEEASLAGVYGLGLSGVFTKLSGGFSALAGASVGLFTGIAGVIAAFAIVKHFIDKTNDDFSGRSHQITNARTPAQISRAVANQTGVNADFSTPQGIANAQKFANSIDGDVLGYGGANQKALIEQAITQANYLRTYSSGYQNAINHYQRNIAPIVSKFADVKDPGQISSLESALANVKRQHWLQYFDPKAYNDAIAQLQADLDKLRHIGAQQSGNPFLYGNAAVTQGTLEYFTQAQKTGSGVGSYSRNNQAFLTDTFRQFSEGLFGSGNKGLAALGAEQSKAVSNIKDSASTQIATLTSSTYDPNKLTSGYDDILRQLEAGRANVGKDINALAGRLTNAQKRLRGLQARQQAVQGREVGLGVPGGDTTLSGEIEAEKQHIEKLKEGLKKAGISSAQLTLQYNQLIQQIKDAKFQEQSKYTTTVANISALNAPSQVEADKITIAADEKNVELALRTYGRSSQQYLDAVATATQARNQAAQNALQLVQAQGALAVSAIQTVGPQGDLQRAAAQITAAQNNLTAAQNERSNPAKQLNINQAQTALNQARLSYAQQRIQNARQDQQVAQQITDAHFDQQIARTTDPLKQATIQLRKAQSDLAAIKPGSYDSAQQYQAAYQDALTKVISAQTALVQARIQSLIDTAQFNEQAGNINEGQYLQKLGQIINQRGISTKQKQQLIVERRQGIIQNDLAQAQFEHDTQKISDQAYIAQLQNILKLKGITTAQKRQLLTQIYQLQHANDGSLDLNVGNIQLPSIYQVRQAVLGGKVGQGSAIVNHTSNVTVNVHKSADVGQVASVLDKHLGTSIRSAARAAGVV